MTGGIISTNWLGGGVGVGVGSVVVPVTCRLILVSPVTAKVKNGMKRAKSSAIDVIFFPNSFFIYNAMALVVIVA